MMSKLLNNITSTNFIKLSFVSRSLLSTQTHITHTRAFDGTLFPFPTTFLLRSNIKIKHYGV